MYKLVVFAAFLAVAAAAPGLYGAPIAAAPIASSWGHGLVGAPLISTGVVKAAVPVATSYANTVRIATPAVAVAAHAPIVAAHAPIIASPALAHGW
ncbi:larval/pupal cuticle protein H1C-like [Battus philenor]|uniref:larval/pupal cuticle protein H1C-like n=1 Tax=Battus philenor TaxID=42288 RepID=UPI0035CEBE51